MNNSTKTQFSAQPSRRQLLRASALLPTSAVLGSAMPFQALAALRGANPKGIDGDERTLIVLQLTGGNDGLNTVMPHGQDAWYRARPTLSSVAAGRHELGDGWALHPALGGLSEVFQEGRLAVVQGVGYPVPDRSHFHSMAIWHSARIAHLEQDAPQDPAGWLGNASNQLAQQANAAPIAVHVGPETPPASLIHPSGPPTSIDTLETFRLPKRSNRARDVRAQIIGGSTANAELEYLRRGARDAEVLSKRVADAAARGESSGFPSSALGRKLSLIAQLIRGGLGARIYSVELGGFDTHNDQLPVHANLMGNLGQALSAFDRSLGESGWRDRVVTLVFSEFGRRVQENLSRGTDHGAGGPVFVMGESVRGGLLGTMPDIEHLERGDIPYTTDFRSIYANLQKNWLGVNSAPGVSPFAVLQS